MTTPQTPLGSPLRVQTQVHPGVCSCLHTFPKASIHVAQHPWTSGMVLESLWWLAVACKRLCGHIHDHPSDPSENTFEGADSSAHLKV